MKTIEKTQDKPVLIALSQLHPHPDNPRVFLQDKTYHEIVEALKVDGFKPEYAGIARPIEGGYQIISGHRRRLASQEAGLESMYIWIREMTDEEAFFQLVKENMKQKELTIIDLGFHVLKYEQQCRERGEPTNTQQYVRYAEHIGCSVSRQYCQRAVKSAKVYQEIIDKFDLNKEAIEILSEKGNHIFTFDAVDECCWDKLLELVIEKQWSKSRLEELTSLLSKIKIPKKLQKWLKLDLWLNKTIEDYCTNNGITRIPSDIENWVEITESQLELLAKERSVWLFDTNGNPYQEKWDLQQMFINALAQEFVGRKFPTKTGIVAVASKILQTVEGFDDQYHRWESEQRSTVEQQKEQEKKLKEWNEQMTRYAPTGFNALPEKKLPSDELPLMDAIVINAISNNTSLNTMLAQPDLFIQKLKEGGVFIAIGFATDIFKVWDKLSPSKLDYVHLLNWVIPDFVSRKKAKIPFSIDSRYAIVFSKGKCQIKGEQNSSTFQGDEENFLKQLFELFVPIDGLVLNPWLDTNPNTMISCKKTQRIGYWIENNQLSFESMTSMIENAQFFWAIDSSFWQ